MEHYSKTNTERIKPSEVAKNFLGFQLVPYVIPRIALEVREARRKRLSGTPLSRSEDLGFSLGVVGIFGQLAGHGLLIYNDHYEGLVALGSTNIVNGLYEWLGK